MKNWKEIADSQMVCYCKNVTKGTIVEAIKNGAKTLNDIQTMTTACTGHECKTKNPSGKCCSGDINEILTSYGEKPQGSQGGCCCGGGC